MRDSRIKKNSVVQINEHAKDDWVGCLIIVDEVKEWGVLGGIKIPFKGTAYIRVTWNEIDYIGEAVLVEGEEG